MASFPGLDDPFSPPDGKPPPNHVRPQLCQWEFHRSHNKRGLGLGASLCLLSVPVCLSLSSLPLSLSASVPLSVTQAQAPTHVPWRSALPKIINDLVGSKGNNQLGRGNEPTKAKFRAQAVTKANTNCSNNLTAGSACRVCLHSPPLNTEHLPSRVKDSCAFDYVG